MMLEVMWPVVPGAVLVGASWYAYAVTQARPVLGDIDLPEVLVLAIACYATGLLARAAAGGVGLLAAALGIDLFLESAAREVLDERSPEVYSPSLRARLGEAFEKEFGLKLPSVASTDDAKAAGEKLRAIDEAVALARSTLRVAGFHRIELIEARADGSRAFFASCLGSAIALAIATKAAGASALAPIGAAAFCAGAILMIGRSRFMARRLAHESLLGVVALSVVKTTKTA